MTKRFITSNEIKKLSAILTLSIADDEVDNYSRELGGIPANVYQLENMDMRNVESLLSVLNQVIDSKVDKIQASITKELTFKNAPKTSGEFFKVPGVIKKNG